MKSTNDQIEHITLMLTQLERQFLEQLLDSNNNLRSDAGTMVRLKLERLDELIEEQRRVMKAAGPNKANR